MSKTIVATYEAARDVAIEAALEAGQLIRSSAGKMQASMIREKNIHDLVTEVDEASQELIIDRLKKWDTSAQILAEEGDLSEGAEQVDGYRWIIDPLDGTTNFTHGMPPYAVSIGLQKDNRLVAGVVLDVSRWELFTAVRGQGVFVNGVRANVSKRDRLGESLLVTGFPYRRFERLEEFLTLLGNMLQAARGVRRTGAAAVDLAYVACGRFEGFFETGLMPWDLAAGSLLVEEGGGRVTDYSGLANQLFGRQVVATNGAIHEALLDMVSGMKEIRF